MDNNIFLFNDITGKFPLLAISYEKEKQINRYFYIIYILIWVIVTYFFKPDIMTLRNISDGFFMGLLVIILIQYLNYRELHKHNITNGKNIQVILKNEILNIPNREGVVVSEEKYDEYVKKGLLKTINIVDYFDKDPDKNKLWSKIKIHPDTTDIWNPDEISYNFMSIILTLSIIISHLDRRLLYELFPWIILSFVFSIGSQSVFIWNQNYVEIINEVIIKKKLFILSLSFGFAIISTVLWKYS
uniref:Uncharacterized protein n=1 Tax=viral metagenome TaxID=1070528 RepID=A0A6C0KDT6_9ZZZZ